MNLPDFSNLSAVITWLATGFGAPYLILMAVSWLAENWSPWHGLPKLVKQLVPLVVAILVSFGANFALQYMDVIQSLQPFWMILVQVVISWAGSQSGYIQAKRVGYGVRKYG